MFVVSMIPIGLASFVTALTALIGPLIEKRVKGVLRVMKTFHKTNHVIICGYSSVSESAIDELRGRDVPYVIIDDRKDLVLHLSSKGHDVIGGDATKREILDQANLRNAAAVVATFDADSVNLLIAVTAKALRDATKGCRCRIIVRVEDEENVEKAKGVGADEVISPSTMAGRLMAARAVGQGPA
jgi:voltage-gated potassium channel